ncbi:hypothetical protein RclHR1_14050004 [Rhizophagus clarus]|uniref:Uncharacterized protein n=1 Tax=Rhizophagus clarus TaxID=94130 RepID=A0A2Z6QBL5_9GLOM|nr:hypothetical protein RclHR1_14050004 [Rhizophagus clarus]
MHLWRGSLDINDVGIGCFGCPNRRITEELQTQFGKLCRVGTFQGDAWKSPTPQKKRRTCRLVHAYPHLSQEESAINASKFGENVTFTVDVGRI